MPELDTRGTLTEDAILATRYRSASRIADDLSHEIKNPLHAMVINLELVKRKIVSGEAEAALQRAAIVEEEVRRVHRLTDSVLRLLRPSPEPATPVDVDTVLADLLPVLEAAAKVARVRFVAEPLGDFCRVRALASDVRQAVLCVFLNALDAASAGAEAGGREGRIELSCSVRGDSVRIRVADNGPGVPAVAGGRLGEPGFTTRPGAAGMGLAVTRHLLAEAGGRLEWEPAPEVPEAPGGAAFVLVYPRVNGA